MEEEDLIMVDLNMEDLSMVDLNTADLIRYKVYMVDLNLLRKLILIILISGKVLKLIGIFNIIRRFRNCNSICDFDSPN